MMIKKINHQPIQVKENSPVQKAAIKVHQKTGNQSVSGGILSFPATAFVGVTGKSMPCLTGRQASGFPLSRE